MTVADETRTRAQGAARQDAFTAFSQRPLRLSGLEPRILFSATPIDPGLVDAGDDASVKNAAVLNASVDSNASAEFESDVTVAIIGEARREIILLDSSVVGIQELLDDLSQSRRQADVFVLDSERDGIDQITEILNSRVDISSIHIVSHAEAGSVKLGNVWLREQNLNGYAGQIASWQNALTSDADILLYGCDLAANEAGRSLVESLGVLTGADIAASSNDTGHEEFSADWILEYENGSIETTIAFSDSLQNDWQQLLSGSIATHAVDDNAGLRTELVFVDSTVQNFTALYEQLTAQSDLHRELHFFVLDASRDGIEQVTEILVQYHDIDAVHILSHATSQQLEIGSTRLDAQSIGDYADAIRTWQAALASDADLLLYGCDLAADEAGQSIVQSLANLTGADVAASTDLTGNAFFGGDWVLEYQVGSIETQVIADSQMQQQWFGLMSVAVDSVSQGSSASGTVINVNHTVSGTDRLMLVAVATDPHGTIVNTIKWNGTDLTLVGVEEAAGIHSRVEIWKLVAPQTGTLNLDVTLNSAAHKGATVGVITFTGVDQAAPLSGFVGTSGTSTTASITTASRVNDVVFSAITSHNATNVIPGSGQTELWDSGLVTQTDGAGSIKAGAASVTSTWTVNNDDWSIAAVSIQAKNNAPVASTDTYTINEDTSLITTGGWFNAAWQSRQILNFNNAAQSQNLTDFPVLVKLDASRIDYSKVQDAGDDLRFVDADGTLLAYEIEDWNEAGDSYVWVRVPQIDASSGSDFIWMYYNNSTASDNQNAAAVWGNDYESVLHLNDNFLDSTDNANNGTNVGSVDAIGKLADGQTFNGAGDRIDVAASTGVNNLFSGGGTISAWINPTSFGQGGYGRIVDKASTTTSTTGWNLEVDGVNQGLIFEIGFSGVVGRWRTPANSIALNQWQLVTVVYDSSSTANNPVIYINGVAVTLTESSTPVGTVASDAATPLSIGNRSGATDRSFAGKIDEVRLESGQRSAQWAAAQYLSTTDAFVTFGTVHGPGGVLANDSDIDGDSINAILVGGNPAHAQSFSLNSDGSFSYTPIANFNGVDTFTYKVNDGRVDSNTVVVSITVNPIGDPTFGQPAITGLAKEYETLTTDTSGISDADGVTNFTYEWLRGSSAIAGATGSTYVVTSSDIGSTISVKVTYTDNQGSVEGPLTSSATSVVINTNDAPVGLPTISGLAKEYETLTANTSGISDADGVGTFSYQWLRGGSAISGATSSTYVVTSTDIGTVLSLQVTYTDGQSTAEGPLTSANTAAVVNTNDVPAGLPVISGLAKEYETLTADTSGISDADGVGTFSYQWLRGGSAISGAISSTYVVTSTDIGTVISLQVSYTDGQGTAEGPLTSANTATVVNTNDAPVGLPTVSGLAEEDQTLTVDTSGISDDDGLGAFSYQWLRSGSVISGATNTTYELTQSDVNETISVSVSYVDGQGTSEGPLTSP